MDSLCGGGGWRERGEASSPGPPGTKGLTLRLLASSREEGRAPGSDPSPGPALTSPSPFILGGRALVGLLLVFGTFKGTCERVRGGSDGNKDSRVDEEGVGKEAGSVKGGGAGERKGEGARKEGARKETQ